jgi:hypothetical protein
VTRSMARPVHAKDPDCRRPTGRLVPEEGFEPSVEDPKSPALPLGYSGVPAYQSPPGDRAQSALRVPYRIWASAGS